MAAKIRLIRRLNLQTFVARTFNARLNFRTFNARLNFQTFVAGHLTPVGIFRDLSTDI
jgi:hypothetical protein